jgi:demethylmenaquinone methyltransferase/2-methoxy-6-polyprenyl-1,4-benzoquinol methylase
VGGAISADRDAYRFLSESIQAFPSPEEIGRELEASRFRAVRFSSFTFGISTLIQAEK